MFVFFYKTILTKFSFSKEFFFLLLGINLWFFLGKKNPFRTLLNES